METKVAVLKGKGIRKIIHQGFDKNRTAARKGGRIAGDAREKLEKETKKKVVTSGNYLNEPENRKRLKG